MESKSRQNGAIAEGNHDLGPTGGEYLDFVRTSGLVDFENQEQPVFLTQNPKMIRIKEIIEQIADANVPVLITGESGTGKEVIAREIHSASNRDGKAFVGVNCAALPSNLLESELFGYEKGAFTGAANRHIGKFEQANGGTLLLDEVTEIEPNLQAKLLRALQEKEIERIGGKGPVKVDARIIATSNRDIKSVVNEGSFRQDLYYRLYVIHLEVPPLRERTDDIELLVNHYVKKFTETFNRPTTRMSDEAMARLLNYTWPGNVRELQNIIQRSILMSKDNLIHPTDLPALKARVIERQDWISNLPIGKKMREVEVHFILETLKSHTGNRTHAARTLGISLRTLRNKINEFNAMGLEVPPPPSGKAL